MKGQPRAPRTLTQLLKVIEDRGYLVEIARRSGHIHVRRPRTRELLVTMASTPSDPRATLNAYRTFRRVTCDLPAHALPVKEHP